MSKMKLDRKPPLARSPARLHSRRVLRSSTSAMKSLQTPPGSLTKSRKLSRDWGIEESELCPEYRSISCELRTLTKMVRDELSNADPAVSLFANSLGDNNTVSVFERGRFYDMYSARRNERLKRKKGGEQGEEKKATYDLGVTVEPAKRREGKKLESLRKSVYMAYSAERNEATPAPRYLLRSSTKENKKPPLAVNYEKSAVGERRIGARRMKKN